MYLIIDQPPPLSIMVFLFFLVSSASFGTGNPGLAEPNPSRRPGRFGKGRCCRTNPSWRPVRETRPCRTNPSRRPGRYGKPGLAGPIPSWRPGRYRKPRPCRTNPSRRPWRYGKPRVCRTGLLPRRTVARGPVWYGGDRFSVSSLLYRCRASCSSATVRRLSPSVCAVRRHSAGQTA